MENILHCETKCGEERVKKRGEERVKKHGIERGIKRRAECSTKGGL